MNNNITKALLALLNKSIVNFTYRKVDGTIRNAVGTRNLCLACQSLGISIPMPKSGKENPTAYYDLEKGAWRSFKGENVLSINGVEISQIKGIKNDRIVPVGSMEEVEIPISGIGGGFLGGKSREGLSENDKGVVADLETEMPNRKGGVGGGIPLGGFGGGIGGGSKPTDKGEPTNFGLGKIGKAISGMVGTPTFEKDGLALPIGSVSIDDFAKLVAKYVVDLLAYRLTK